MPTARTAARPGTEPAAYAGRPAPAPRRRTPGRVGAAAAALVFLLLLLRGHPSLLQGAPGGSDFYDVQAHSLLDLRWDVPRSSLFLEGFEVDGRVYMYFGPFPALLRLPVAAVTDELDGRLGQVSMLAAFAVAMFFTARLVSRIRPFVRGSSPVTAGERWAVELFVFVVGAGSVLVFLASESYVYHEAVLWCVALALGAFEAVIAFVTTASRRQLAVASALSTGALLSRSAVGIGAVIALALVFAASAHPRTRRLAGLAEDFPARATAVPLLAAMTVPLALYACINYAKFGTLFSVPFERQLSNQSSSFSQNLLAANGGTRFNLELVPTSLVQYFRPDQISFRWLFPWVAYGTQADDIGDVVTERIGNASYTASMPLLTLLGLIGIAGLVRSRRAEWTVSAMRAPVLGAAAATIGTLAFASIAHRYVADFLPVGVLLAIIGMHQFLRWSAEMPAWGTRVGWGSFLVLVVASVWINAGLGVMFQRLVFAPKESLPSFVSFQYDLHERFPGGSPPYVESGARLPAPQLEDYGTAFVIGSCDSLHWTDGRAWHLLERSDGGGAFRFRVRFPGGPTGWEPLVVSGQGDGAQYLAVRVLKDDRVQVAYNTVFASEPVVVRPGSTHDLEVVMDALEGSSERGTVSASLDGREVWGARLPNSIIQEQLRPLRDVHVGKGDVPGLAPRFTGRLDQVRIPAPLCEKLTGGPAT
jgi:hypothetical protein